MSLMDLDTLAQIIGVPEAARIIGVQPHRVREYIAAGQLPASQIDRTWILLRHNAEAFKRGQPGGKPGKVEE